MNRENEEQRPVAQSLCSVLQKEPNCKCLVLSVLIYGCLAAVTWCRCANVTKVVINFSRYPIKSTKHVSPCDDGYIYIPVAFMGMLYLVYLVECYHSPIRIDLLHAEGQDSVLSKLSQLRTAQPTIWWKAVSYHYVRRKRQITRYRNGDNYTTTQVYYERINTHAATSFYYYDYCGVKDISKELILDPNIPITKIVLTKGFAFSNMRSATEFEEARSRFFAEQELRDDYMEMKEGLDLGYNPNPTTLVAILGNPWFTNRYVYWCLSALLLSWPLRVIIEYKTQYADYQITKLFGINYDTPTGSEHIHTSMSQLSHPGSYMLAPSYSEALLMDPAPSDSRNNHATDPRETIPQEIVPSYSEALLYERAEQLCVTNQQATCSNAGNVSQQLDLSLQECSCPCHTSTFENNHEEQVEDRCSSSPAGELLPKTIVVAAAQPCKYVTQVDAGKCGSCGRNSADLQSESLDNQMQGSEANRGCPTSTSMEVIRSVRRERMNGAIPRDMSEPNLRSQSESIYANTRFLRANGESLQNILESEQEVQFGSNERVCESNEDKFNTPETRGRFRLSLCSLDETNAGSRAIMDSSRGAIPKRTTLRSRVIANPMSNEVCQRLPNSKTYFCLKSILKQNRRRYTLITARELQNFSDQEDAQQRSDARSSYHEGCNSATNSGARFNLFSRSRESLDGALAKRGRQFVENSIIGNNEGAAAIAKRDSTRTLIFASPIQEICPGDPFAGRGVIQSRTQDTNSLEEDGNQTVRSHLTRASPCDRRSVRRKVQDSHKQHYMEAVPHNSSSHEGQYIYPYPISTSTNSVDIAPVRREAPSRVYKNGISFPPYEGAVSDLSSAKTFERQGPPFDGIFPRRISISPGRPELTRSLTERRSKPARNDPNVRRSFAGVGDYTQENGKRTHLNMETSL